jgi:hypothetical protein
MSYPGLLRRLSFNMQTVPSGLNVLCNTEHHRLECRRRPAPASLNSGSLSEGGHRVLHHAALKGSFNHPAPRRRESVPHH